MQHRFSTGESFSNIILEYSDVNNNNVAAEITRLLKATKSSPP